MLPRINRLVCLRAQRGGFALLITIVLLAFLVLLLVSLATLTRVETTVAQNSRQLSAARQNALFALQVAIGQLQQTAGPDQRVTARADILDTAIAKTKAPYWTGVWQAQNPAASDQFLDQGSNLRNWSLNTIGPTWLVSTTPGSPLDPRTYDSAAAPSAKLASAIGASAVDVRVPLIDLSTSVPGIPGAPVIGRYAYWVSDEGVKAKVNLVDPTFGQSDPALSLLHMASPQALPLQRIFPLKDATADYRSTPVSELSKILYPQALPFLSTVPATVDLKVNGPDITAYSWGVLADVQHGGLKRDLTAAFEDTAQFDQLTADYGYGDKALYRATAAALVPASLVPDMTGVSSPDGPLWHSLFYYYNTYKSAMTTPAGLGSSAVTPQNTGSLPHVLMPRVYCINYPSTATNTVLDGIAPIVLASRVDIALSSYSEPDGNGDGHVDPGEDPRWKLRLQYYPQLVLKNPYSVRLSLANFQANKGIDAFRIYSLSLKVGGVTVPAFDINQAVRYSLGVTAGNMDVLEPGETRVFALSGPDVDLSSISLAGNFANLTSPTKVPSTSADHYQSVTVPGFACTTDNNASVSMTLTNNPLFPFIGYAEYGFNPASVQWPRMPAHNRFSISGGYYMNPPPSKWSNRPISSLETPVRVIGFFSRLKGLQPSLNAADYRNGSQNIPLFMGNTGALTVFEDEHSMRWQETYLSPAGTLYTSNLTAINTTSAGETTWGDQSVGEAGSGASVSRIVLRDAPVQPLVSLGQFMHASFYRFTETPATSLTFGSMFVGGSIASPFISSAGLSVVADFGTSFTGKRLFLDDSFLANQALFDRFFFSTVPPATATSANNAPAYWTSFNGAPNSGLRVVDASKPLLNARIKPVPVSGQLPLLADLRDSRKAAANLLLDGAFNINSTSVPAWRALLSALSGNRLNVWNATGGALASFDATAVKDSNPIPRFWSGSTTGQANAPWDGLRMLDDTQINELASRIVDQVRARGPFLSMADFLNRRLGADSALTRAGALQAAIDNTSPDINAAAKALGVDVNMTGGTPATVSTNLYDATGKPLKTSVGIPGYLMQQDLVQDFSPVMTARSDTFVIRTRGDAVNAATGVTEGHAWLEAVVQRTSAFVDQTDPALKVPSLAPLGDATPLYAADGSANVNAANVSFGRRFVVVRFRWLNENEL